MVLEREWRQRMGEMFLKEEDLREERNSRHSALSLTKKFISLRKKKDISAVFKRGKAYHSENMVLLYLSKGQRKLEKNDCRVAIITSKKVGKAVQRNRARRIIREALRKVMNEKLTACDIIIIAKNKIVGKKMQDVKEDLEMMGQKK